MDDSYSALQVSAPAESEVPQHEEPQIVNAQIVQPNGAPHVYDKGQGPLVSDSGYLLPPRPGWQTVNKWKDGLCSVYSDRGACMMVWCLPCVPLAQLYERLVEAGTFPAILVSSSLIFMLAYILQIISAATGSAIAANAASGINIIVGLVIFAMLFRLRANVRRYYNIPEEACHGCEDCCCAWWCGPCVTCQIMRQVNDYSGTHKTGCTFTETGMPAGFNPQFWYGNAVGTTLRTTQQHNVKTHNAAFLV